LKTKESSEQLKETRKNYKKIKKMDNANKSFKKKKLETRQNWKKIKKC